MTDAAVNRRRGVWWAGLVVASAAAAATAHGIYAVAIASGVPAEIAVLYPVMTDGLALVAYSASNRLRGPGRRYAWTVVLAAAGLSGLAQALYLAGGGVRDAPPEVRFGIGAVPAVAAAAVAHLLHLVRTTPSIDEPTVAVQGGHAVQALLDVQPVATRRPDPQVGVQASTSGRPVQPVRLADPKPVRPAAGWATSHADQAARRYQAEHGTLPTTSELVRRTGVSRGTAGTVLKGLRANSNIPPPEPPRPTESDQTEPSRAAEPDQSRPPHDDHLSPPDFKIQNDYTPRHHDPEEDQKLAADADVRGR